MRNKVIFLFLIIVLSACSTRHFVPYPVLERKPLAKQEALQISEHIQDQNDTLFSYRSLATVSVRVGKQSSRYRQLFAFQKPNNIRLEMFPMNSFFTVDLLVANSENIIELIPNEKKAIRYSSDQEVFQQVLRIPVERETLMDLLLGNFPLALKKQVPLEQWKFFDTGSQISLVLGDFQYYAELEKENLYLKKFQIRGGNDNNVILDIEYKSAMVIEGRRIPSAVSVWIPKDDARIYLDFTKIQVNAELKGNLFEVVVPGGYVVK